MKKLLRTESTTGSRKVQQPQMEREVSPKGAKRQKGEVPLRLRVRFTDAPLRKIFRWRSFGVALLLIAQMRCLPAMAQATELPSMDGAGKTVQSTTQDQQSSLPKYFDPGKGVTVDDAVAYARTHNCELLAAHREI